MEPRIHSITPGEEPDLDTTRAGNAKTDVSEAGSSDLGIGEACYIEYIWKSTAEPSCSKHYNTSFNYYRYFMNDGLFFWPSEQ